MLSSGCATFERFDADGPGRDRWQHPDQVVGSLAVRRGARVADIGAGGGYFTFRFARAVGPSGKVYAVDVDETALRDIEAWARSERMRNVVAVRGGAGDPLLPAAGVDLVFLCDTYHHLADPVSYFRNVRRYLKPGGRVAIIDFAADGDFDRWMGHVSDPGVIYSEMRAAGYRLTQQLDYLPRQHFLIFAVEPPRATHLSLKQAVGSKGR